VYLARTLPLTDDEQTTHAGLLAHLDAVYGFALALTGDAESAADLTEDVFAGTRDELWVTLGGHSLRDRLLARCVSVFRETFSARARPDRSTGHVGPTPNDLVASMQRLPWDERAALTLVDQLGLRYAAGAAVLGVDVAEFRALLHRARSVLFVAFRAAAR
jgi:DNA-directed RNA polymerase specialized sigma24 family protein